MRFDFPWGALQACMFPEGECAISAHSFSEMHEEAARFRNFQRWEIIDEYSCRVASTRASAEKRSTMACRAALPSRAARAGSLRTFRMASANAELQFAARA